jgi:hypothetical protein
LNPWVSSNAMGKVQFTSELDTLAWSGIPMFTPTAEPVATPVGSFLVLGVGSKPTSDGKAMPPELFSQLIARPNLVYYDWEFTEAKLAHWIYHGQTARLALLLPQMPTESAAMAFLVAVGPKLGNTGTEIVQDGPNHLSLVRNSHSGFTAVELHLLADWLESPAFPRGFHTLLAPRPQKRPRPIQGKTNSLAPRAPGKRATNSPALPR